MSLQNEVEIVHLLYYRNKNQHRQAKWWKYLSILHRRINQLVVIVEKSGVKSDKCQSLVRFLLHKIIPASYIQFRRVLAQGQYIPLGFALVASTARLNGLLDEMIIDDSEVISSVTITQKDTEDLGEVVSREELNLEVKDEVDESEMRKKSEKEESKKKKKKKAKKMKRAQNAIDEIFGF